jgi:hypothetical protein
MRLPTPFSSILRRADHQPFSFHLSRAGAIRATTMAESVPPGDAKSADMLQEGAGLPRHGGSWVGAAMERIVPPTSGGSLALPRSSHERPPGNVDRPQMRKIILTLPILLVAAGAATAQYLYEQRLSLGYAPILMATLQTTQFEERAVYIREARIAVRIVKDRESEAKLEQMQGDPHGSSIMGACSDWKFAADQWEPIWQIAHENIGISRSNDDLEKQIADLQGKPYRASGATAADLKDANALAGQARIASKAYMACLATKEAFAQKDGDLLNHELYATTRIPSL